MIKETNLDSSLLSLCFHLILIKCLCLIWIQISNNNVGTLINNSDKTDPSINKICSNSNLCPDKTITGLSNNKAKIEPIDSNKIITNLDNSHIISNNVKISLRTTTCNRINTLTSNKCINPKLSNLTYNKEYSKTLIHRWLTSSSNNNNSNNINQEYLINNTNRVKDINNKEWTNLRINLFNHNSNSKDLYNHKYSILSKWFNHNKYNGMHWL